MSSKETNPKDAVGVRKWRQFTTVPLTVVAEVGAAMLEGARKYGRHNYRVAGVRSSVYIDAAMGHLMQYWEGEDIDADSGLHHVVKAMASLAVLRDAMLQDMLADDRPPKAKLDKVRDELQKTVEEIMDRWPDAVPPYTATEPSKSGSTLPSVDPVGAQDAARGLCGSAETPFLEPANVITKELRKHGYLVPVSVTLKALRALAEGQDND